MDEQKLKELMERKKENKIRSYNRHLINQREENKYRERDFLSEISFNNRCGGHLNCFRYFPNNTESHEITKFLVFITLRNQNHNVFTEAIFNNSSRADVIDITEGIIYEVTYTETEKELEEKIRKYPEIFEVRQIDSKKDFDEKLLL